MQKLNPALTPLKPGRESLKILNQLKLPHEIEWVECHDDKMVSASIKEMHVRGAPAIGIAAAYGFYLGVLRRIESNKKITPSLLLSLKKSLDASRPTAVNLMWATDKMVKIAEEFILEHPGDAMGLLLHLYNAAREIHEDDANRCLMMSENAADSIIAQLGKRKFRILTHCNTGALATGGIGTALGVIRVLAARDLVEVVYADETRPYLQGARLTAFELQKEKIPNRLIADSMAGYLMQKGQVDFVIVGADRITRGGDVANKIGTYSLSVLAKYHKIPFYVIAPRSTFDAQLTDGSQIPIEERPAEEVTHVGGVAVAAKVKVLNYSFDVTPRSLISQIFFEDGKL